MNCASKHRRRVCDVDRLYFPFDAAIRRKLSFFTRSSAQALPVPKKFRYLLKMLGIAFRAVFDLFALSSLSPAYPTQDVSICSISLNITRVSSLADGGDAAGNDAAGDAGGGVKVFGDPGVGGGRTANICV
jgi:hypothetical protein